MKLTGAWARWRARAGLVGAVALAVVVAAALAAALGAAGTDSGTTGRTVAQAPLLLTVAQARLRPGGLPEQHKSVSLDHRWDREFPGRGGSATYTLQLPAQASPGSRALFFEHVGNQVAVSVNGVLLDALGELGDPALDAGRLSHMVVIPSSVLRWPGSNELVVEATMQPLRAGGLAAVHFGATAQIGALQVQRRLLDQSAAAAYAASFLLMGSLAAGLWWRQRDALYGCFGLAALCGVLRHLDHVSPAAPLPWPAWGALLAIGYGCHLALIARFVLLVLGQQPRRLVQAINLVLVAVVLLASLSFWLLVPALWTAALVLLEGVGLACFGVVLREAVKAGSGMAWLLLGAGAALLLAGTHDIVLVRMGLWGGSSLALMPHAMFFLVFLLAGLVVARYSRSVADYRALNGSLAQRVAERERQLHEAFEALRVQQEQQAVMGERQRMMREIHDGVGSQLVGLLNMVHQPSVGRAVLEEQVRAALDEMRMAVDSLQPVHSDLTTVLATLRYRLQPRLQAAGIEVVWAVSALPRVDDLSPQAMLQIQRILLEAFTNVLKHARASRVLVNAVWREAGAQGPAAVLIRVCDNGVGLPGGLADDLAGAGPAGAGTAAQHGHGLPNMRSRAGAIGATLCVEAAAGGGCCVVIEWPISRAGGGAGAAVATRPVPQPRLQPIEQPMQQSASATGRPP